MASVALSMSSWVRIFVTAPVVPPVNAWGLVAYTSALPRAALEILNRVFAARFESAPPSWAIIWIPVVEAPLPRIPPTSLTKLNFLPFAIKVVVAALSVKVFGVLLTIVTVPVAFVPDDLVPVVSNVLVNETSFETTTPGIESADAFTALFSLSTLTSKSLDIASDLAVTFTLAFGNSTSAPNTATITTTKIKIKNLENLEDFLAISNSSLEPLGSYD